MEKRIPLRDLLDEQKSKQHLPALRAHFEEGGTWQELFKLSDGDLESHYLIGYEAYYEGRYPEALEAFTSLTILNPYEPKYWFALGATHQLQQEYAEAAEAYELCGALREEDPTPFIHAARCLKQFDKLEEARALLERAIERGDKDPKWVDQVNEARSLVKTYA